MPGAPRNGGPLEMLPKRESPHALATNVQLGLSISRVVQFEVIQELSL